MQNNKLHGPNKRIGIHALKLCYMVFAFVMGIDEGS